MLRAGASFDSSTASGPTRHHPALVAGLLNVAEPNSPASLTRRTAGVSDRDNCVAPTHMLAEC
jgi:hypothetical protein